MDAKSKLNLLLPSTLIIIFVFKNADGIRSENFTGIISPEDNKTFIQYLAGPTEYNYSTITWEYNIVSKYYTDDYRRNPIVYFRHRGQEGGYGTKSKCFNGTFGNSYGIEPRLVQFTPSSKYKAPGQHRRCYLENSTAVVCSGTIQLAIGLKREFYASMGFRCGWRSALDVEYNITVTAYEDGEVPCSDWSEALDELKEPIPIGLKDFVQTCSTMYSNFSRWNALGASQYDMEMLYLISVVASKCYQHLTEFLCYGVAPKCANNTVTVPCAEMCVDLNKIFTPQVANSTLQCEPLKMKNYTVACTSLANLSDPDAKPCFYDPVVCEKQPSPLPPHAKIISQTGRKATDVAYISCDSFYGLSNHSFTAICWYDGLWHFTGKASCEMIMLSVVGLAIGLCVSVAIVAGAFMYKFRFELKLLAFKYIPCCICCFFCSRRTKTEKTFDAFIAYEHDLYQYVRHNIHEPLEALGYKICVDYANFQFTDNLVRKIPESISKSARIIIILNQGFLDSNWCQYELDQAIMNKLEDASLEFLVILKQDKSTLKGVPRWLRGYLRTHIYIEEKDPFFMSKLLHGLPAKTKGETQDASTDERQISASETTPLLSNSF